MSHHVELVSVVIITVLTPGKVRVYSPPRMPSALPSVLQLRICYCHYPITCHHYEVTSQRSPCKGISPDFVDGGGVKVEDGKEDDALRGVDQVEQETVS